MPHPDAAQLVALAARAAAESKKVAEFCSIFVKELAARDQWLLARSKRALLDSYDHLQEAPAHRAPQRELLHLKRANLHVGSGRRCIERQCTLIAELTKHGLPTGAATSLLNLMFMTMRVMERHRSAILNDLGQPRDPI